MIEKHSLMINELGIDEAREVLSQCCGAGKWVEGMLGSMPFKSNDEMLKKAEEVWHSLDETDWLEAFSHHPKIGDLNSLKEKHTDTKHFAQKEQSGMDDAAPAVIKELVKCNQEYEKKFGYIFIVCATGKSADEMLAVIKKRIKNDSQSEIKNAMAEQNKITKLRMEKLL